MESFKDMQLGLGLGLRMESFKVMADTKGNLTLTLTLALTFKDMAEIEGKHFIDDLLTEEGLGKEDCKYAFEGAMAGHRQYDIQLPVKRKDGTTAWLLAAMRQRKNVADEVRLKRN